jgi:DNA-binding MarR family transcriptional regulator/GNAT superfamily N-acetyltransferase
MDPAEIQLVRRFNRRVTQQVGALEDSYLRRGRSLGKARLIFETGPHGADVRTLRNKLGMESGYLGRLLRSLETRGLIEIRKQTGDGRVRRVSLTLRGLAEYAIYDRLSDDLAQSILEPLGRTQPDRLVTAMAEVDRLIRAAALVIKVEAPASADARWCLSEYIGELATRFETGFDPARSNPAGDAELTPPAGFFVVARLDGDPVGCGALKCGDETTGEIKRMWTARSARGMGVARRVLQTLETLARAAGLTTLHLETNRTLTEAQALYHQAGYAEVAPFNDEPYAHFWFEKQLTSD